MSLIRKYFPYFEEQIYKKLDKHSAQKNIERANNRGVKIEEINENNIPEFFDVYLETHDDGKSRDEYCEDQIKYWKIAKLPRERYRFHMHLLVFLLRLPPPQHP